MTKWKVYTVEITSASIAELLSVCNNAGCQFKNIKYINELCIHADVDSKSYRMLNNIVNNSNSLVILKTNGVHYKLQKPLQRSVLVIGCVIWILLVLFLPTRVLFVQVDGNHTIDTAQIIEAANKSGIRFGASRRYVRSEKVKNILLSEIDKLQWAGINTYGCVAIISVKERLTTETDNKPYIFSSIVAKRDGIISQVSVTNGNKLCHIGQAVRKGEILVSGYTNCGLSIKAERSDGEILAFTGRHVSAVTPRMSTKKSSITNECVQFSIQIGKYIIKLYNNSSIPDVRCDKIYEQKYLTLPGGFRLPVSLIKETTYVFDVQEGSSYDREDYEWLKDSVSSFLIKDMIAGRILQSDIKLDLCDDICLLTGSYTCNEMIGQVRIEKIGEYNG